MKNPVKELLGELQRLEKCDEVLTHLFFHHRSQAKSPEVNTAEYHRKLCMLIMEAHDPTGVLNDRLIIEEINEHKLS
jgi:hypothetical protein